MTTARLKGLEQDLGLTGESQLLFSLPILITRTELDLQYATVIAILYVSYCPAQIPSNMLCHIRACTNGNDDERMLYRS